MAAVQTESTGISRLKTDRDEIPNANCNFRRRQLDEHQTKNARRGRAPEFKMAVVRTGRTGISGSETDSRPN